LFALKKNFLFFFSFLLFFSFHSFAGESNLKSGYEAFLNKDYTNAISFLKGANLPKNHLLIDYYLWALGKSQIENGAFDEGIKNLEELLRIEPESLFSNAARVAIGKGLQGKGDFSKAKEHLKPLLSSLPEELKGEAIYCLALSEMALGEKEAGRNHFREVYIEYPSSVSAKDAFAKLQEEGISSFAPQELLKRADHLFEAKSFSEALKTYEAVLESSDPTLKNLARIKKGESLYFLKRYGDAILYLEPALAPNIPSELARTALFHLGISHQKSGDSSQAKVIFERVQKNYPGTPEGEEALYRIGRIALDEGRSGEGNESFQRLADAYPHGNFRDKGLWNAGWSAYRNSDWNTALKFFSALEQGATDSPTMGKAIYWQARVLEKQGDSKKATQEFVRASQKSPFSYYGFLAIKQMKHSQLIEETPDVPADWKMLSKTSKNEGKDSKSGGGDLHYRKAIALYKLDMGKQSLAELQAAIKQDEGNSVALFNLLENARKTDAYYIPVLFGQKYWESFKSAFSDPKSAEDYRATLQFPFAFRPEIQRAAKEFSVSPYLVIALMRQESGFQPWVISSANAQGLMQLLTSTARTRARSLGDSMSDLLDPVTNIRLGTAELKALLDRFSGNWIYAIAGYNAGPGRPPQWATQNGNLATDEFVEEIPFSETNLYVKLVLRNYWTYKTLYQ
jgi:soluble lytic murein transglycosylase